MSKLNKNWLGPVLERIRGQKEVRRVFHGRGKRQDGPTDLALEWYPPVLLALVFSEEAGERLREIESELEAEATIESLVVQDRWVSGPPRWECRFGEVPEAHRAVEDGFSYEIKLRDRQNPGLFLASREARRWVRDHSEGLSVLNLFSFTGAFGVCAVSGGAEKVVQVDMKRGPLMVGKDNLRMNDLDTSGVAFWAHDILKSKGKIKRNGPWDLVILDPPTFQKGAWNIERDLPKLIRALGEWTSEGSKVLLCVHDPFMSHQEVREWMSSGPWEVDETLELPEGYEERDVDEGLKAIVFRRS